MVKKHRGAVKVKLKPNIAADPVAVGEVGYGLEDSSTVIISDLDGFKRVDWSFRQRWIDEEEHIHNLSFIWKVLTKTQTRTKSAVNNIQFATAEVLELEKIGPEYCVQHDILKQVKRVPKAARADGQDAGVDTGDCGNDVNDHLD